MTKIAKTSKEAYDLEDKHEGNPHGWIQWKGTDVCMDIHCKCGHHSHIDAAFTYNIQCPKCNTIYRCNPHIEFIEITDEVPQCLVTSELED